jgi:hypothetical protein
MLFLERQVVQTSNTVEVNYIDLHANGVLANYLYPCSSVFGKKSHLIIVCMPF